MTWREANLSLQLAAEERAGFVMRYHAEQQRAQQDAAFDALRGRMSNEPR